MHLRPYIKFIKCYFDLSYSKKEISLMSMKAKIIIIFSLFPLLLFNESNIYNKGLSTT